MYRTDAELPPPSFSIIVSGQKGHFKLQKPVKPIAKWLGSNGMVINDNGV
jgi:hypothetical protein